jgi:hypothetical protein
MSTPTTSTLNSPRSLSQPADSRTSTERTAASRELATTLQPGSKSPVRNLNQSAQVASDGSGSENVTGVPAINVKPVDRRTIEGSTPGDFRSQASKPDLSPFANPPGPRDGVCQSQVTSSKLQGKTEATPSVLNDSEASYT